MCVREREKKDKKYQCRKERGSFQMASWCERGRNNKCVCVRERERERKREGEREV